MTTIQFYPKALVLFVIVLLLGFAVGAWSMAAVWRIGLIAAVGVLIVQRLRGMRPSGKF